MTDDEIAEELKNSRELLSLEKSAQKQIEKQVSADLLLYINHVSRDGLEVSIDVIQQEFIPKITPESVESTERLFAGSLLLGLEHAFTRIEAADGDTKITPITFKEAVDFLKSKVSMTRSEWDVLEPEVRFRAFTVSRLSTVDYIETARKILVKAVESGSGFTDSWKELMAIAKSEKALDLHPGYWENVYRTNTNSAYNAGKIMQFDKSKPAGIQLFVIDDSRTSDICRNLLKEVGMGLILPRDHSFWKKYGYPPYHYQCRTGMRGVFSSQVGVDGIELENPNIKEFDKFNPLEGFGGDPVEKGSWWKMTEGMATRAAQFGVFTEIEAYAKENGLHNFAMNLVAGSDYRRLEGTPYTASKATKSDPLQKEIAAAKVLEDEGHSVYFTPVNRTHTTKNPDAIVDGKLADFKTITSKSLDKIEDMMIKTYKQKAHLAILTTPTDSYTQSEAVQFISSVLGSDNVNNLDEVYLIWGDDIINIKK